MSALRASVEAELSSIPAADQPADNTAEEESIVHSPLSRQRVQSFLASYVEHRRQAAVVESLFDRASSRDQEPEWKEEFAYGFNVLLRKAPFVEGSNWLPYSTREFATAAERNVMGRLERLFRNSLPFDGTAALPRRWEPIFMGVNDLIRGAAQRGYEPDVLAVAGPLETDLRLDLSNYAVPRWTLPTDARLPWIIGMYENRLMLHLADAPRSAIYVADLRRFGRFIRYGGTPRLTVTEFDERTAAEAVDRNPNIVRVPDGRPDTREERIRQLRLHVNVRLFESDTIVQTDDAAVLGAQIR